MNETPSVLDNYVGADHLPLHLLAGCKRCGAVVWNIASHEEFHVPRVRADNGWADRGDGTWVYTNPKAPEGAQIIHTRKGYPDWPGRALRAGETVYIEDEDVTVTGDGSTRLGDL